MLTFNFDEAFHSRGITNIYGTLIQAGFTQRMARDISEGNCRKLYLDRLETICEILNCTPDELITFTPGNDEELHENHALKKLEKKQFVNTSQILNDLTFDQLNMLVGKVNDIKAQMMKERKKGA